jgi:hypothetical protein
MPSCRSAVRLIVAALGSCAWLAAGGYAQVAPVGDVPAPLRAGLVIEREIEAGASHRYELPLGVVAQRADWPAGIELFSAGAGIFQAGDRAFESRLFHATNRYVISPEDARHGIDVLTQVRACCGWRAALERRRGYCGRQSLHHPGRAGARARNVSGRAGDVSGHPRSRRRGDRARRPCVRRGRAPHRHARSCGGSARRHPACGTCAIGVPRS